MRSRLGVICVIVGVLAACGKDAPAPTSPSPTLFPSSFTGKWNGTTTSDTLPPRDARRVTAETSAVFNQAGESITGTLAWRSVDTWTYRAITGIVTGDTAVLTLYSELCPLSAKATRSGESLTISNFYFANPDERCVLEVEIEMSLTKE